MDIKEYIENKGKLASKKAKQLIAAALVGAAVLTSATACTPKTPNAPTIVEYGPMKQYTIGADTHVVVNKSNYINSTPKWDGKQIEFSDGTIITANENGVIVIEDEKGNPITTYEVLKKDDVDVQDYLLKIEPTSSNDGVRFVCKSKELFEKNRPLWDGSLLKLLGYEKDFDFPVDYVFTTESGEVLMKITIPENRPEYVKDVIIKNGQPTQIMLDDTYVQNVKDGKIPESPILEYSNITRFSDELYFLNLGGSYIKLGKTNEWEFVNSSKEKIDTYELIQNNYENFVQDVFCEEGGQITIIVKSEFKEFITCEIDPSVKIFFKHNGSEERISFGLGQSDEYVVAYNLAQGGAKYYPFKETADSVNFIVLDTDGNEVILEGRFPEFIKGVRQGKGKDSYIIVDDEYAKAFANGTLPEDKMLTQQAYKEIDKEGNETIFYYVISGERCLFYSQKEYYLVDSMGNHIELPSVVMEID